MLLEELFDFDNEADIMINVLRKRIAASMDGKEGPRVYIDVNIKVPQVLGSGEEAADASIQFKGWLLHVGEESVDVDDISWSAKSATDLFALTDFGNVTEVWITDKLYDHDLKSGNDAQVFAFNNGSRFGSRRFIPRQVLPHLEIEVNRTANFIKFHTDMRVKHVNT